eukprot:COSAG04_NODE_5463_length_1609_cov_9.307377_2_plen_71_part_00
MYDSGSRVAMMLSGPGVAPGQVINDLTSLNDVFPTCADTPAQVVLSSDPFDLLFVLCWQRAGHGGPLRAV